MAKDVALNTMDAPAGFSVSTPKRSDLRLAAMLLAGVLVCGARLTHAEDRGSVASGHELSFEADMGEDYEPWQPFNGRMFSFDHGVLDRFVVKPAATAWDKLSVRNGYLQRRRRAVAGRHAALLRGGRTLVGPPAPAPALTRAPEVAGSGA